MQEDQPTRRRWWQGLFARVTMAYAIGAAVLSAIVAFASYTIALNRLLAIEENRAEIQFFANADLVRQVLEGLDPNAGEEARNEVYRTLVENRIRRTNGSDAGFNPGDGSGVRGTVSADEVEFAFGDILVNGNRARIRYRAPEEDGGDIRLALGIRMNDLDTEYYEILSLASLESTLADLRRILIAVSTVAAMAGAGLGYYSSRRALAPVGRISEAAEAIAAGDFSTRLGLADDPDLGGLSASFDRMVDALSERIERDERFASDVSHELRSPLMTLTASLEVLERRKNTLPDVLQTAITLLREDLTRFERLVEDLLEISRMDAGAVEADRSSFLLAEFLFNVVAQSRAPDIEIHHQARDGDLMIHADKRRLAQVVTNLIENGAKYAGGVTRISFRRIGDNAQIVVEDAGPGVPPEERARIFERFNRIGADAGRRGGQDTGVGLGLSLVAEHMRLHGGRAWVTDRDDGRPGASFVVEFPIGIDELDLSEFTGVDDDPPAALTADPEQLA